MGAMARAGRGNWSRSREIARRDLSLPTPSSTHIDRRAGRAAPGASPCTRWRTPARGSGARHARPAKLAPFSDECSLPGARCTGTAPTRSRSRFRWPAGLKFLCRDSYSVAGTCSTIRSRAARRAGRLRDLRRWKCRATVSYRPNRPLHSVMLTAGCPTHAEIVHPRGQLEFAWGVATACGGDHAVGPGGRCSANLSYAEMTRAAWIRRAGCLRWATGCGSDGGPSAPARAPAAVVSAR